MCNHAAQSAWNVSKNVTPSLYLDVEMTAAQSTLLNPTFKNVLQGFITYDVKGKGAKQKMAQRRLEIIEGNISSYSRCLNDPKRMKAMIEHNQLIASVAEISADMEQEKTKKRAEAVTKAKEKETKKKRAAKEFEDVKAARLPEMNALMEGRVELAVAGSVSFEAALKDHFTAMNRKQLLDLIKYYHEAKPVGIAKMQKEELVEWLVVNDVFMETHMGAC